MTKNEGSTTTMTTPEVPVAPEYAETDADRQVTEPVSGNPSKYTRCASYKEAKYLAASRRRVGEDANAVFVIALDSWCIR